MCLRAVQDRQRQKWYPELDVRAITWGTMIRNTHRLSRECGASGDMLQFESLYCCSNVLDSKCLSICQLRKRILVTRNTSRHNQPYTGLKLAVSFKISSPGETMVVA